MTQEDSFKYTNLDLSNIDGRGLKFICDGSLCRVGKHLRMLGVDCVYNSSINMNYLLFLARKDDLVILTKNRGMVKHIISQKKNHEARKLRNESNHVDEDTEEVKQWKTDRSEWIAREREQNKDFDNDEIEEEEEEEQEEFYEYKFYFVKSVKNLNMIDEVVNVFKISFIPEKVFSICLKCNNKILPVEKEEVKGQVYDNVYNKYDEFFRCTNCKQVYWGPDDKNQNFATALDFASKYSYKPSTV
ncbi:PDZD2 [Acrasis kona]|uniref:PDZD2 n=1 Tax=Acrasis kona TaxID=1008807 RepID=A0AAW2YJN1_9EUKA